MVYSIKPFWELPLRDTPYKKGSQYSLLLVAHVRPEIFKLAQAPASSNCSFRFILWFLSGKCNPMVRKKLLSHLFDVFFLHLEFCYQVLTRVAYPINLLFFDAKQVGHNRVATMLRDQIVHCARIILAVTMYATYALFMYPRRPIEFPEHNQMT